MATASPPAGQPAQSIPIGVRLKRFWRRVTEGMEVSQLWSQFENEARASYRLYSKDVEAKTPEGLTRRGRHLHVIKEFFWAVFEKLSPARRVLLLVALILLAIPQGGYNGGNGKVYAVEFDLHFWAGLLLLLLLILEIADRVVMKRDLQIAREIQTWLLPGVRRRFRDSPSPTLRAPPTRSPETTTTFSPAPARPTTKIALCSPWPTSLARVFQPPCSWPRSRRA